jgi:hypothetical protein
MNCWICGQSADSGEHRVKASDLRLVFGHVSQRHPLFMHNAMQRNRPIKGIKSDVLKSDALICRECNNHRTQPYDNAWQQLSTYLSARPEPIRTGDWIKMHKVFPGAVTQRMLDVHLFFAKLFGCIVVERKVPMDISGFSQAILKRQAHPLLFIAFGPGIGSPGKAMVGYSDLYTARLADRVAYATWIYHLAKFTVSIIYAIPGERRKGLVDSWHPSTVSKCVRVTKII